jgi:cytochrome P450
VWEKAFTPAAIKSYELPLQARKVQLLDQLDARLGRPLDLADWFGFFSTDFMNDFAYGGTAVFESMAQGADHAGAHSIGVFMLSIAEAAGTVPWLRPVFIAGFRLLPDRFLKLANEAVDKRIEKGSQFRDLFYYLVRLDYSFVVWIMSHPAPQLNEDGESSHPPLSKGTLGSEAGLAIIAGSDTTGTALANAMFYLMTHPECMARLRAELDEAAGAGAAYEVDIDADNLAELKYLQAIINETVRLQPALPNGVQRTPPSDNGDVLVAGQCVGMSVLSDRHTHHLAVSFLSEPLSRSLHGVVRHLASLSPRALTRFTSVHRDMRYFSPDPDAFWPERWLAGEGPKIAEARGQEFKLAQGAYMPFNYGPPG